MKQLSDFDYNLPEERIAKYPVSPRDSSKLLFYSGGRIEDRGFQDLASLLPTNSTLVFNNTKVIPARLFFQKSSGAIIQVFLLKPVSHNGVIDQVMEAQNFCTWECMIGNKKKWKKEELSASLSINSEEVQLSATWHERDKNLITFQWQGEISFAELVKEYGQIPLPPYLNRETETADLETYQTVYSEKNGAVAAPTAGLHFTQNTFEALESKGVRREFVTLHVGAGTFQPVKNENIEEHKMHGEQVVVTKAFIETIASSAHAIIPVGTTSMRTLESLYWYGCMLHETPDCEFLVPQMIAYDFKGSIISRSEAFQKIAIYMKKKGLKVLTGNTEIFILPGYKMKVCDGLITNFHQPKSTLLMLISALVGEDWKRIYEHALSSDYRFLSYGDSSLLLPQT